MPAGTGVEKPENESARNKSTAELNMNKKDDISGTSYYDLFLNSLRIGKATIEVEKEGDDFMLKVAARARSNLSKLYSYKGKVAMSANPIQPTQAVVEEQAGSKHKITLIEFPEPDRVTAVQIETRRGKKPKRTEKEFSSESFVLDPFSTVFLLRSLNWAAGTTEVFDIFTGNKQYELQLFCRGETALEVEGTVRDVWEIVLQTRSLEEPRKKKMSGYVVYLSRDSRRDILKVTGKAKIGRIVASMRNSERDEG
ncbi:MAG: hypothetical protein VR65_24215 [Desulfobulbaceae bacterium BRH_c16a]|nr:MAG: hypothetical protein VR65_24215 [Desulfobulbaceae bacterium BRH_c16a]